MKHPYVGIIQIRLMGRRFHLPLSLYLQAPRLFLSHVITYYYFCQTIPVSNLYQQYWPLIRFTFGIYSMHLNTSFRYILYATATIAFLSRFFSAGSSSLISSRLSPTPNTKHNTLRNSLQKHSYAVLQS